LFFVDMDRSLREMGVGDLTVPKRVRSMAESTYGRLDAYSRAVAGGGPELAAALARNLFPDMEETPAGASALAGYVGAAETGLAAIPSSDLLAGVLTFPDPTPYAPQPADAEGG